MGLLNLLTAYQKKHLVEFLPYHECDTQSRQAPDLECLIKLQAQHTQQRHLIFLTGTFILLSTSLLSVLMCWCEMHFPRCLVVKKTIYMFRMNLKVFNVVLTTVLHSVEIFTVFAHCNVFCLFSFFFRQRGHLKCSCSTPEME